MAYVFGWATDWSAVLAATREADVPRFLLVTLIDKAVFFFTWALLQAEALRRFVGPVSTREVLSLRGGSEILRALNNSLGDAAFLLGLIRLTSGRIAAVVAATSIPFAAHFFVLLLQATLSLAFLDGGAAGNRDVAIAAGVGWITFVVAVGGLRLAPSLRFVANSAAGWLTQLRLRALLPFVGWFVLLAAFDVVMHLLVTRAFGLEIPIWALIARIPVLYAALSLPSFASFGTRELAWAALFADFAPRDTLIAFAFVTNATFLVLNTAIGMVFLPRAVELLVRVRLARAAGQPVPEPLLHDASDP